MKHQNQSSRRYNRTLLCCALASCLALAAPIAIAQTTAATVRGQVTVDAAPAADARVTATNLATGLTRTVQATGNGSYTVTGLPPGTYRIDVAAGGRTSSQTVRVQVGQTATLDLAVGAAAAPTTLETVTVVGTVLPETKTSEVATYVSQKQIEVLPQASRNFLAFADTVPGMIFETSSDDSTKLRGGAQNSNGINVFIDGVGQKNYVLKGGVSSQDSTSGNPFPQLAIGEYKVITSNYKAEYDQVSSAAITAVTKSGTNEFDGSVFWDRTSTDWRSPTFAEERAGGRKTISLTEQYGASFGGPIIRDRLFFFMTYEAKDLTRPRDVSPDDSAFSLADLTEELRDQTGPTSAAFEEDMFFGKLTWQPDDANLVELSAKVREEVEVTGIGGANTLSYASNKNNDSTRIDLRWQWTVGDWLNDAHITSEDDYWNPRPVTIGPGYNIVNTLNDNNGRLILNVGGGRDFQDKGQKGYAFQDDLTFTGWEGHTIKGGVKFKSVRVDAFQQQPFNQQFRVDYYRNLAAGNTTVDSFIPFRVEFGAPLPGIADRNVSSRNKQFGIYLQDDWEVNEHLTLNFGLRYDYEETPSYLDHRTPDNLAAALRGWQNIQNTDYNIEDYISNGNNRDADDDNWAPRLGFSYDLNADQRHVIFGGAGRSYDRNLFDYLALEQARNTFPTYSFNFDVAGHPCTQGTGNCVAWDPRYKDLNELYALVAANPNLGQEVNMMNNNLETPYSDQFSLGMRNVVPLMGHDWSTSVTVAHIRSYDGIIFSLGNRYPDGTFYGPGRTFGGAPFGQPIPGFGTLVKADNGLETRANQLLLSAEKPFTPSSPWSVTLAYTYTDSEENRSNAANGDEHYVFDYPNLDDHPWVESIGISKHRFVGTGVVEFWGLTFSTKLTLASPAAKNVLNCIQPTPAGLDNCAYGTFEAGYFDDAKFRQWDIAVQKEWTIEGDLSLWVRGDVFNVTNAQNLTDFGTFRGVDGVQDVNYGIRTGNGTVWPPRMFKLSAGFRW
ncbi:TonB-dependent receptor [Lysobacter sp. CFH 32150]|uniref:TonB-dependent receptor n=1 Tax=Lysobacter sp. CFH 32150 TaxID=2927128 RepID=UPI001FA7E6E0|nr:TonB-dependent receptor [Lysobacter sp. CFH 32150]MCI4567167.1 TonB-dependent receptor [Lysobacter sp. CFH 32150]